MQNDYITYFKAWENSIGLRQKSRLGIYVHVPFCPHICPYCDFLKTSKFSKVGLKNYFSLLKKTLSGRIENVSNEFHDVTLYIGGGTPSLLAASYYHEIVDLIKSRFTIEEFTIETNPFTNPKSLFEGYKSLGVNRITLGAQSLSNDVLRFLGRKHTAEQVRDNVDRALEQGIEQVQVDLIYGINEKILRRNLAEEIDTLVSHGVTGISTYALTIESRTHFAGQKYSSDDVAVEEYNTIYARCVSKYGMKNVETSNFSFHEAKHNNIYWYGLPYIGVGTGSHGLLPPSGLFPFGQRYKVGEPTEVHAPGDDNLDFETDADALFSVADIQKRTRKEYIDEMLFTLPRTPDGIPLLWLNYLFTQNEIDTFLSDAKIQKGLKEGKLFLSDEALSLSWPEKMRGDSWSLHFSHLLNNN